MRHDAIDMRGGHGWQLILADLALILFLLALSALPATESGRKLAARDTPGKQARPAIAPEIAAAQALYRPIAGGPSLSEWIAAQPRDPRATLTVFVSHRRGEQAAAWAAAKALASDAQSSGVAVRSIITAGVQDDIYASLAYDAVMAEAPAVPDRSS